MKTQSIDSLAAFTAASHLSPELIQATVEQFGGWDDFTNAAPDVCRGGIDGGFHGFIYTADTHAFATKHRKLIAALAKDQAADFGTTITEMIQGFGCFRHGPKPTDEEIGRALYAGEAEENGVDVLNALAGYAGEEVARSYCELTSPN